MRKTYPIVGNQFKKIRTDTQIQFSTTEIA